MRFHSLLIIPGIESSTAGSGHLREWQLSAVGAVPAFSLPSANPIATPICITTSPPKFPAAFRPAAFAAAVSTATF